VAISFARTADAFVIVQARRALRRWLIASVVLCVWGVVVAVLEARHTERATLRCDRPPDRCAATFDSHTRHPLELPASALASAGVTRERREHGVFGADELVHLTVARFGGAPPVTLCTQETSEAARRILRAKARALQRFIDDPSATSITLTCDGHPQAGVHGLVVRLLAGSAGMLLVLLYLALYVVETRVELDRKAGVVRLGGRRLIGRSWSVERPLRDVVAIRSSASRTRAYWVELADGARYLLCSPARGLRAVDAGVAEVRTFLGHKDAPS